MGDRATIAFAWPDKTVVRIYLHNEGYRVAEIIRDFINDESVLIAQGVRDSRFGDPSYLAARFVAWRMSSDGMGIGIVPLEDKVGYNDWVVRCSDDLNVTAEPEIVREN